MIFSAAIVLIVERLFDCGPRYVVAGAKQQPLRKFRDVRALARVPRCALAELCARLFAEEIMRGVGRLSLAQSLTMTRLNNVETTAGQGGEEEEEVAKRGEGRRGEGERAEQREETRCKR